MECRHRYRGAIRAAAVLRVLDRLAPELEALGLAAEETGRLPERLVPLLVERGVSRMTLPEVWGGSGLSFAEYVTVLERAAHFHPVVPALVDAMNSWWRALASFGTEAQRSRWLPLLRDGRWCALVGEPDRGAISATLDGEGWVLDGSAEVSFGADAALHLVLAATETGAIGARAWSCILVPRGARGLTSTAPAENAGWAGALHARVVFERCRVPAENLLGGRGEGLAVASRGFIDPGRLAIAASCLGRARHTLAAVGEPGRAAGAADLPGPQRGHGPRRILEAELYALGAAIDAAASRLDDGLPIGDEAMLCELLGTRSAAAHGRGEAGRRMVVPQDARRDGDLTP
jgi:alkylation response protein AidB-like acyl-CoA dehydrogenase